jgi:beta propeller repeat protein
MRKALKSILSLAAIFAMFLIVLPVQAVAPEINFYQITNNGETYKYEPSISGDNFVWREANNDGGHSVYLADISDPESIIRYEIASDCDSSAVSGDMLIWSSSDESSKSIYLANISDPDNIISHLIYTMPVINNIGTIAIQGSYVYWSDDRNGSDDIFMADISDPENPIEYPVTGDMQGHQSNFSVNGNTIVWSDSSSGDRDVSFADISDPENIDITTLTIVGSNQMNASVYSNYIVWEDDRDGDSALYLYNIENGSQEKLLSLGDAEIMGLSIVNSDIYWTQFSDNYDSSDIYTVDFEKNLIPANLTEGLNGYDYYFFGNITETGDKFGLIAYGETEHIFMGVFNSSDSTSPTFSTLPGETRTVNLTEGELITTNPYIIKVNPADDTAIEKVEFYVDGVLICTDTTADADGVYECAWDTSLYHSDIRIVAYDTSGNTVTLNRTVNVDPSLYTLPRTGMNLWDYVKYLVVSLKDLIR